MKHCLIILFAILLFSVNLVAENPGITLDTDISLPPGQDSAPCVIICPGRGYHKDLPLVKDLAARLNEEGFATLSFNWSFFTQQTQPSPDGSAEMADIDTAIAMAKASPGIDVKRIYLAGKSLGSVFGYHAFREHPELRGCVLLTPVIPDPSLGKVYYPGLKDEKRPVVFILGDTDTANCPLPNLYTYLADTGSNIPVVVLSGGHSFEINSDYSDPINIQNTRMAIEAGVYWLKRM